MDQEKIQAYRDEQQRQSERKQELAEVSGIGNKLDKALNFQTLKLIANANTRTNKVKSVDPIASPKDIQAVVDGLNALGDKLAPKELKPVIDALSTVVGEISKLPKTFPKMPEFPKFPDMPQSTKVDNLSEIEPWLKAVVVAIGKLELNPNIEVSAPNVTVPETKIDLTPITQGLIDVKKALDKIKLPETDFSRLESAVANTTKAINGLSFPAPNFILPYKTSDGSATQGSARILSSQIVGTDTGIVANAVIHGKTTAGDGSYVDVKVNPSGALKTNATISGNVFTESAIYDKRLDDTTTLNMIYIGEATPGTATSAALWRIKRLDVTSGLIIQWSDSGDFTQIWNNRDSLSYV